MAVGIVHWSVFWGMLALLFINSERKRERGKWRRGNNANEVLKRLYGERKVWIGQSHENADWSESVKIREMRSKSVRERERERERDGERTLFRTSNFHLHPPVFASLSLSPLTVRSTAHQEREERENKECKASAVFAKALIFTPLSLSLSPCAVLQKKSNYTRELWPIVQTLSPNTVLSEIRQHQKIKISLSFSHRRMTQKSKKAKK